MYVVLDNFSNKSSPSVFTCYFFIGTAYRLQAIFVEWQLIIAVWNINLLSAISWLQNHRIILFWLQQVLLQQILMQRENKISDVAAAFAPGDLSYLPSFLWISGPVVHREHPKIQKLYYLKGR